jgi:hypothetical protein
MNSAVDYEGKYARHCRRCKGWGLFKRLSPNVQFSECPDCFEQGKCPRCAAELTELSVCPECTWEVDDQRRGLPGSNVV